RSATSPNTACRRTSSPPPTTAIGWPERRGTNTSRHGLNRRPEGGGNGFFQRRDAETQRKAQRRRRESPRGQPSTFVAGGRFALAPRALTPPLRCLRLRVS